MTASDVPDFTAQASLYRSSGHYRTGRHARNLPRRTNSLRLALDEGEVIVVRDCRPGFIKLGEGVCVRDPSLPGGGGAPPGPPDEPGAEPPPPPGGGPGEPPEPVPHGTKPKNFNPKKDAKCHSTYPIKIDDGTYGLYSEPDIWACCVTRGGSFACNVCEGKKHTCRDGHVDPRPNI
jgi:hypothetical protein